MCQRWLDQTGFVGSSKWFHTQFHTVQLSLFSPACVDHTLHSLPTPLPLPLQHYAAWTGVAEAAVALTSAGANILAKST